MLVEGLYWCVGWVGKEVDEPEVGSKGGERG